MGEEKHDKIVAAALRLFEEQGYHNTKVSDIVREAGVAQGTFYLYFKSKEDLFRSLVESCLGEIVAAIEKGSAELCGDDTMHRIICDTLHIYAHNKTIFSIIAKHGIASPELKEVTFPFYRRMMTVIKSSLEQLGIYSAYGDKELEIVAYAKIGMVEAAAYQSFVAGGGGGDDVPAIAGVLVGMLDCRFRREEPL